MNIKNLKLKNFRNYSDLDIELSDHLNIFIGDNAQGKSNILESIVVLAITKSYMNVKDKSLIKDGMEYANLSALVDSNNIIDNLFISFDENNKKIKINGIEIKKYSEYISKIRFILFSPYDITFIKDSPAIRRKIFNIEISQLSNKYVKLLQKYNAILKKRNLFLKTVNEIGKCDNFYLDVLNNTFCSLAVDITIERKKFVDNVNQNLSFIFKEITGYNNLKLNYISNIDVNEDRVKMRDLLLDRLEKNFDREKYYGMTLIGPHRDDYSLFLDGKDLSIYGSQGQNRAAILSLKLAEISIFKDVTGDYPILLLDDIFSELDIKKKNRLVKYILNDVQTIITTTDLNMIDKSLIERAKIFRISCGKVVVDDEKEGKR